MLSIRSFSKVNRSGFPRVPLNCFFILSKKRNISKNTGIFSRLGGMGVSFLKGAIPMIIGIRSTPP